VKVLHLAMWSGPRNISTAMMRSWENRSDCAVVDEPLYAHYLHYTGLDHPGREQVIGAGECDWRRVAAQLVGPAPAGRAIFYQKHMTHHLLPHVGRDWLAQLTHVFLIRDPRRVVLSYVRSRPSVSADDIGVTQQLEIFNYVRQLTGAVPPVIDSAEFLQAPERYLRALCARLGIEFQPAMLHWPAGSRASDGIWAPHWYDSVYRSTGFEPYTETPLQLPAGLEPIVAEVMPAYEVLHAARLR
jgi:hypothetical protein